MRDDIILRLVCKFLIPFIMLFGLYIQFHGDFGPGGGFQAGVVFASAFVLYVLVYGIETAERLFPVGTFRAGVAGGVLLYAGVGLLGIVLGGNFLDYGVLADQPAVGQHIGIMVIEFGVGVTVASVIVATLYAFARPRK